MTLETLMHRRQILEGILLATSLAGTRCIRGNTKEGRNKLFGVSQYLDTYLESASENNSVQHLKPIVEVRNLLVADHLGRMPDLLQEIASLETGLAQAYTGGHIEFTEVANKLYVKSRFEEFSPEYRKLFRECAKILQS